MSDKTNVYLDTSVLVKWYLPEANSTQVTEYIISLNNAAISTLTKTEMRCLLARRKRMQEIDADLEAQIYATFLDDIAQGHLSLYKVDDKHLESASYLISILPKLSLRTLDALHLAIAQHYGFEQIASADNLFAKAADALGFKVDVFV
jgi:predicted nucleic acid-binding protein